MPSYTDSWPAWAKMLVARFGQPKSFDPDAWQMALDNDVRDNESGELLDCMAWMQTKGQEWKPPQTVADLRRALYTYRKTKRAERDGYRAEDPAGFVGNVKAAMLKAPDWLSRWDAMVSPSLAGVYRSPETRFGDSRDDRGETTAEECDELDAWAVSQWPDWHERVAEEMRPVLAASRAGCKAIAEAWRP